MSSFSIMKQEYPATKYCFMLVEHVLTSDGIRSRICSGRWETVEEVRFEMAKKQKEQGVGT